MTEETTEANVFHPEGIKRLLERGTENLSDDQRVLLAALIGVEADRLDDEGLAALDELKGSIEAYDAGELTEALEHLVSAKPRKERELDWPGLDEKLKR